MTNQEWQRSRDPLAMIRGLIGVASGRKGRLYLVAGCRPIWDLLYSDWSREAVEVAERYADGLATDGELNRAAHGAECPTFEFDFEPRVWRKWLKDGDDIPRDVRALVRMGVLTEAQLLEDEPEVDPIVKGRLRAAAVLAERTCSREPFDSDWWVRYIAQVESWLDHRLLRCIFGKPFLSAVDFDPRWLTTDVLALAGAIYEEKAFDRLPILGDALEEAGSPVEDALAHCRSGGPHARGCWVVDRILGKS